MNENAEINAEIERLWKAQEQTDRKINGLMDILQETITTITLLENKRTTK